MRTLLIAAILFLVPTVVRAQTGACPTGTALAVFTSGWLCVTAGADYDLQHPDPPVAGVPGVPKVVRIDVLLFGPTVTNTATGTPTQTLDIGHPARNAQGAIWVQRAELTALPVGQVYKARAVQVGQPQTAGGPPQVSGRSPESNPFVRMGPAPAPNAPLGVSVPPGVDQ